MFGGDSVVVDFVVGELHGFVVVGPAWELICAICVGEFAIQDAGDFAF